jgi:hypothetical protein
LKGQQSAGMKHPLRRKKHSGPFLHGSLIFWAGLFLGLAFLKVRFTSAFSPLECMQKDAEHKSFSGIDFSFLIGHIISSLIEKTAPPILI